MSFFIFEPNPTENSYRKHFVCHRREEVYIPVSYMFNVSFNVPSCHLILYFQSGVFSSCFSTIILYDYLMLPMHATCPEILIITVIIF
jgi:hypothetical protein